MSKKEKHWILGDKSFLDSQEQKDSYNVGIDEEAKGHGTFLNAVISSTRLFRVIIPRYYHAITRRLRPRVYDPLVTVTNDSVIFFMRDVGEHTKGYWRLELSELCFKSFSDFQKGTIFVDFNRDFIQSIQTLKRDANAIIKIDQTGLTYTNQEGHFDFLPHEDRSTLINLLQAKERSFSATPDAEFVVKTAEMWDQSIKREPIVKPMKTDQSFTSLFDSHGRNGKGEVYNPFYCLALTKSLWNKSKVARLFFPKTVVKYYEENNEYLLEIPLLNNLGTITLNIEGRQTSTWGRNSEAW